MDRNTRALHDAEIDVLVCTLPMDVLLCSGYWPVIGTSLAVFTREGRSILAVPEDEHDLAERGWADDIRTFKSGSLHELNSPLAAAREALSGIASTATAMRVGFESDAVSEPSTYAAMNLYGAAIGELIAGAFPRSTLVPAGEILTRLRSTLTLAEIAKVKTSCAIAAEAFTEGKEQTREGLRETQAAAAFRTRLSDPGNDYEPVARAGGFAYCMSGENSYEAFAAFQLTRNRQLKSGDLVLIHCNSYADGFWTDITRTYCMGEPDERKRKMYDAVLAASRAAMGEIRSGVEARSVDAAARGVLSERGFGKDFVHGLGHAVGFHAIDHNAPPRLHPASPDVLEIGMVFNIEPAIYIEGFGGMRHCDMVAVTKSGAEVLTPFQSDIEQMVVR